MGVKFNEKKFKEALDKLLKTDGPTFNSQESESEIENRFGPYRRPTDQTIPRFEAIQVCAEEFAHLIDIVCPNSKEKSTALTQLVGVKMSANASIAIHLT